MKQRDNNKCYYWLVGGPDTDNDGHEYYGVARHFAWEESRPWEELPAYEVMKDFLGGNWEIDDEWDRYFPTIEIAKEFQARFSKYDYAFNIIAICPCKTAKDVEKAQKLIGYIGLDISDTGSNSILIPSAIWRENKPYRDPLDVLWDIDSKYARLCVNNYGLLDNYEDAVLLRDYSHALELVDKTNQTVRGVRILAIQQILD